MPLLLSMDLIWLCANLLMFPFVSRLLSSLVCWHHTNVMLCLLFHPMAHQIGQTHIHSHAHSAFFQNCTGYFHTFICHTNLRIRSSVSPLKPIAVCWRYRRDTWVVGEKWHPFSMKSFPGWQTFGRLSQTTFLFFQDTGSDIFHVPSLWVWRRD